tara:strand:- start:2701 stop:3525 length:825 start_codon:yes stop_codon:yes gene_type:complete
MTGIRELTKEQFSDGTHIDGNRVDRAMADTVDRFNNVRKKDMKRRWVQTQFVGGYTPQDPSTITAGKEISAPWLYCENDILSSSYSIATAKEIQNKHRIKASSVDTVTNGDQFAMTNAFYFRKPVVISGLSVCMLVDSTYPNSHVYTDDYDGHTDGDPANDLVVNIEVDNPFLPEDKSLSSIVYHRGGFNVTSQKFRGIHSSPTSDMLPAHPGGALQGIVIDDQDLNIPLSRDTRARVSIVIPNTTKTGWLLGGGLWFGQCYSWTLTVLESTEE